MAVVELTKDLVYPCFTTNHQRFTRDYGGTDHSIGVNQGRRKVTGPDVFGE